MKRWVLAAALMIALVLSAAPDVGAQAADDPEDASPDEISLDEPISEDDSLTLDDIGEGRCFPETTLPGRSVECRFPIVRSAREIAPFDLPVVADQPFFFDDQTPARCEVRSAEVVCDKLEAFYRIGHVDVSLRLGFGKSHVLAGFEVANPLDYEIDGFVYGGSEPVAMTGRPVVLGVYPNSDRDDIVAWVQVRRRGNEEVLDVIAVETGPGGDEWPDTVVAVPDEPGRYTLSLCVGALPESCEPVPGNFAVQVISPELNELIEGHNRADAERINVVFVGSGFGSTTDMAQLAAALLTLDGPVALDFDGKSIDAPIDEIDPLDVVDLVFGPFAIEPLRSHVGQFNFWYLDGDVVDDHALFHNADPEFSRDDELAGFGLPNTAVVTLDYATPAEFGRSEANWTSFRQRDDVPEIEELNFAGVYLAINSDWPFGAATTLAHELGHALFDLRDEYYEFERDVQFGYPNCAASDDEAGAWWGDLLGDVDPFLDTYVGFREQLELYVPVDLVESLTVGFNPGGCYGDDEAVRPTEDSIMNSEIPIFGSVNRRRIEDLLARFSGRAILSSYDDVDLRCFPSSVAIPGRVLSCKGSLAPAVDAPAGRLRLTAASTVADCTVGVISDSGRRSVRCGEVELSGIGPWTVTLTIDSGRGRIVTRVNNTENTVDSVGPVDAPDPDESVAEVASQTSPPTTRAVTTTTISSTTTANPDSDFSVTGDGTTSVPWALAAGAFALAFVGVGGYLFSRKPKRGDGQS